MNSDALAGIDADTIRLHSATSDAWLDCVLAHFDEFLIDHAANERKASSMALSLMAHYPDRPALITSMIDLALEELNHFRLVVRLIQARNLVMTPDVKDPYVNQLRARMRPGPEDYFLDRLLSAAVIEARGEERFRRLAGALDDPATRSFYETLARSEQGHHQLFVRLAHQYFPPATVRRRLDDWLAIEQTLIEQLPITSRVH